MRTTIEGATSTGNKDGEALKIDMLAALRLIETVWPIVTAARVWRAGETEFALTNLIEAIDAAETKTETKP